MISSMMSLLKSSNLLIVRWTSVLRISTARYLCGSATYILSMYIDDLYMIFSLQKMDWCSLQTNKPPKINNQKRLSRSNAREVKGYSMFSVATKLKKLKYGLRKLNVKHGNVFEKVQKLREELFRVQNEVVQDPDDIELRNEEFVYHQAYKDALIDEEKLLIQKSKMRWLNEGDANTAYFHNVVKCRVNRNRIAVIEDMDGEQFCGDDVAQQFVTHFYNMLGKESVVMGIQDTDSLFVNKLSSVQASTMIRRVEDLVEHRG